MSVNETWLSFAANERTSAQNPVRGQRRRGLINLHWDTHVVDSTNSTFLSVYDSTQVEFVGFEPELRGECGGR